MESNSILVAHQVLSLFAVLLISGAVSAKIAGWLRIPDIVVYLLAGIAVGPYGFNFVSLEVDSSVNQIILVLGASVLLFHGGLEVSFEVLRRTWITLFLLATAGVLVSVMVVGTASHYILGIGTLYAFLLAAVLAPTDPAALVPIFQSVKIRDHLAQTILSESAFNDATASIITFTLLGVLSSGTFSVSNAVMKFLIMAGGGIIVGGIIGLIGGFLVSDRSNDIFSEFSQILMLPMIIAAYMVAEQIGASGFMSVFVAGLIFGNLNEFGWKMKKSHEDDARSFIHIASLLLRIMIFMLLGTHVDFGVIHTYGLPSVAIASILICVARPITVLVCTLPDRRAGWEWKDILFMFWARETGVIPAALAGMLYGYGVRYADLISAVIFVVILATLTLQSTTKKILAKRLGLLE